MLVGRNTINSRLFRLHTLCYLNIPLSYSDAFLLPGILVELDSTQPPARILRQLVVKTSIPLRQRGSTCSMLILHGHEIFEHEGI